ncbi:MAG: PD40 domain-containing protein [Bacteroidales bacterium]|nr:PD40 domain-containing protein [Bacteroidales bacterium]
MKKLLFIILIFISIGANAQFYNGLQMNFGKNRIQYKPFDWKYYRYNDYDIYCYERGVNLGKYVAENIESVFDEMSTFFGVDLRDRVLFIVYNNLSEFRQTNIGLQTGNVDFNIGGQYQILENKVFIFYQGDHQKFMRQIREVVARLYVNQILYGTAFTDKLTNSTLLNVPKWFEEGLVSYVSQPYDMDVFNNVKDLLQTKKHISFNHLSGEMAKQVGHSFWYFISDTYGDEIIANILYFSKISKSIKNSMNFVVGMGLKDLVLEWRNYYNQKFDLSTPDVFPDSLSLVDISKKKRVYQQFKVSPNSKKIAFVENYDGRYKIFMYDVETGKTKKLYKEGQRLEQIVDYSYPLLSWNKTGDILAFTVEHESNVYLWMHYLDRDEPKSVVLPYVSKVLDFSFSPIGGYIVFSSVSNGFTDLFVFNLMTGQMERITNDLSDELNPTFSEDNSKIIFSSNRTNDTLQKFYRYEDYPPIADNFDLYAYDFKNKTQVLTRLTNTKYSNETEVVSVGQDYYMYLSDSVGFKNRFMLKYDSVIAFVDTVVHYKYFSTDIQVTNYSKNIIEQDLNRGILGEIIFNNKKSNLYSYKFDINNVTPITNAKILSFTNDNILKHQSVLSQQSQVQASQVNTQKMLDSLKPIFQQKINQPDTSIVDINNYQFEIEEDTLFGLFYNKKYSVIQQDTFKFNQLLAYQPTFYLNDATSQIDFSMINQSYQPFTGGPFYFNPGMSLFTTVGVDELFDNYRLMAGFRWGFNGSMEYLLSVENLERRLDKQLIYHRQIFKMIYGDENSNFQSITKTFTNELMYAFRYPFNQVSSIKGTLIGKYDRNVFLSLDYNSLVLPDTFKVFSGFKMEYIFDNSRELSLNLEEGIKFKLFGEFYQQVNGKYDYTTVLGGDFRFYKNIFRNMIFATRFAGSTSFGSGKVIFYLGGVDNWMDLSIDPNGDSYFDPSVNINPEENYLFQAVATNMRGFPQNIRNGNTFLVSNTELRAPVIQMLFPYPINSEFWSNLQIVTFFDIGTAWSGLTPYDEKNYYNTIIEHRKPFTVIVDVERPPFVYGYGWGLRSKLFGYFVRVDWSWGVEGNIDYGRKIYFSLSKDF